MIARHGNNDCLFYDWFLTDAEERFGKEIYVYIEGSENENIAAFNQSYKESQNNESDTLNYKIMTINDFSQSIRFNQNNSEEKRVTIELLINYAKELSLKKDHPNPFSIRPFSNKFAKHANIKELKTLAHIALDESSDFIRTALLHVFKFVNFPLDIRLLLPHVNSENKLLRDVIIETLSRIKDKQIRLLAIQLFNDM